MHYIDLYTSLPMKLIINGACTYYAYVTYGGTGKSGNWADFWMNMWDVLASSD